MGIGTTITELAIRIGVNDDESTEKFGTLGSKIEAMADKWSSFGNAGRSATEDVLEKISKMGDSLSPLAIGIDVATAGMVAFGAAATTAMVALYKGGELNVTQTAFENLARTSGVSSESITKSLNQISHGTLGIKEGMQLASLAIRAGLSEDQITAVYEFAKKYSEATGKGFAETANAISEAIMTGRTRALKTYGLMADDTSDLFKKMKAQTAAFGEGAFNFEAIAKGVANQIADFGEVIGAEWNRMLGKSLTGDALKEIVAIFGRLVDIGPEIGEALGKPLIAIFDGLIASAKPLTEAFADTGFQMHNLVDAAKIGGVVLLDMVAIAESVVNAALVPISKATAGVIGMFGLLKQAVTGVDSKSIQDMRNQIASLHLNTDGLWASADKLAASIGKQGEAAKQTTVSHADLAKSLTNVDEKSEKVDEALDKNKDAILRLNRTEEEYSEKAKARAKEKQAETEGSAELVRISGEKQALEYDRQDKENAKKRAEAAKAINDAIAAVNTQSFKDALNAESSANKALTEAKEKQAEVEEDIARQQHERDLKRQEEEVKAKEATAKNAAQDKLDEIERNARAADEIEKRNALSAKREKELQKQQLEGTTDFVEKTSAMKQAMGGSIDPAVVDASTTAMVTDSGKTRDQAQKLIDSNNRLASAIERLCSGGIKFLVRAQTSGATIIDQFVRILIEKAQIMAETEGAEVSAT